MHLSTCTTPRAGCVSARDGKPLVDTTRSTGKCTSDAPGVIVIPNLGPNRYGATVSPPAGQSGWVQTTTLEGGHDHDIWVQEGDTGLDTEFIKGAEPVPATQFGFVRVKAMPTSTATGEVKGVAVAGLPYIGGQNGQVVPETGWAGAKYAGPIPSPWVALSDLTAGTRPSTSGAAPPTAPSTSRTSRTAPTS